MLDALGIQRADLITHDIGNMVGYAFAAQYQDRVARFSFLVVRGRPVSISEL